MDARRVPSTTMGSLWKQSTRHRLISAMQWKCRCVVLEAGQMHWLGYGAGGCRVRRGTINFQFTECEVEEVSSSISQFVLRPLRDHVWSSKDEHRHQGTAREFCFDTTGSELTRAEWIKQFKKHIACGQARAGNQRAIDSVLTEEKSFFDGDAASARCAICLETLANRGTGRIVKTPCNHHFHAECVHEWVLAAGTCPMCRAELF
eukprot:TRINITY_DN109625_c0_g1_i1.p1 TRINITY_DN109625_c0_g1~~TRINITY_DN109625_c0_g1_i1.p1  ORF type:complete len:205 (+),score=39.24 TRINITY_DN109625_c0_g1_i1:82-696(+)